MKSRSPPTSSTSHNATWNALDITSAIGHGAPFPVLSQDLASLIAAIVFAMRLPHCRAN